MRGEAVLVLGAWANILLLCALARVGIEVVKACGREWRVAGGIAVMASLALIAVASLLLWRKALEAHLERRLKRSSQ